MKYLYIIIATFVAISLFSSCKEDYQELNQDNQAFVISITSDEVELDITMPSAEALVFEWTPASNYNTNAAITYIFEMAVANSNFENSYVQELLQGDSRVAFSNNQLNDILVDSFLVQPNESVEIEARVIANVHAEGVAKQVTDVKSITVKTFKQIASDIYLIGDAAPNGWSADNATKMNTIASEPGGFVWQGRLNAGELKFITKLGDFLPSYNKGEDDNSLLLRENEDDSDDKFEIESAGIYKITLNIIDLIIDIEALEAPEYGDLWVVGGFTGWSFVKMNIDENDPYIFYFNEKITSPDGNSYEEFKIATLNNFDEFTVFLRPAVNLQGVGENLNVERWSENEKPDAEDDYKWKISTDSYYKIKLDIRDMKISISTFNPYPSIYLVGEATPNGWDINNATEMNSTADENIMKWTGELSTGEFKFTCDKQDDWNGDWFLAMQPGIEPSGNVEKIIYSKNGSNPDNKWKITSAGTYSIELNQLDETVIITKQ